MDISNQDLMKLRACALQVSTAGITIRDVRLPGMPIVDVNAGFEKLTGYTREELLNDTAMILHGPETRTETIAEINEAIAAGREHIAEMMSYHKDGTSFWSRLSMTPLKNDAGEVTHYVFVHADITEHVKSNEEVRSALELLENTNEQLTRTHKRMRKNLAAAEKVQRSLLPERMPEAPGVNFAWRFRPCENLGGDILNVIRLDDRHIGVYLLDVTGHGTAAALMAVTVSRLLTPLSLRSSLVREWDLHEQRYYVMPPGEVADRLNRQLPWDPETGQFFTLIYGVLDKATLEFKYTTAGHPGPAYLPAIGDPVIPPGHGMPVGLETRAYDEECIQLSPGDRIVLYCDGATEVMNHDKKLFGGGRLLDHLSANRSQSLDMCLDGLFHLMEEWNGSPRFADDLSLLALEIDPTWTPPKR
jgi:PAS domain S-box-containing protein